jgi:sugar lactone lactonase YvrE
VGWRFSDSLDALGFVTAKIGQRVLVTNESEDRTYNALVGEGGTLTDLRVFADRGGESVATDDEGRVYIANGQVFVYDSAGRPLGEIDVPERPIQLIVGGAEHRTLFMLAHHALFAISIPSGRVSR